MSDSKEWIEITDPGHKLRAGVDQFTMYGPKEAWGYVRDSHGLTCLQAGFAKARCMRKDLPEQNNSIRTFSTGATRNTDNSKFDYEGFLSPSALQSFASYMHKHRMQKDGTLRASDNWQKGIPDDVYMKSMWRHFMDLWSIQRELTMISPDDGSVVTKEDALCALLFNVQGMLHEHLKRKESNAGTVPKTE